MAQPRDALIALGSNLGDRAGHLQRAVQALGALGQVVDTSFLYETRPVLLEDQPWFLNAACRLRTRLSPHDLLRGLQRVENDLGRARSVRYGPRTIDLDLAFYADCVIDDPPFLILPHYQADVRAFVLEPLCDMVPDFVHPRTGRTLRAHWQALAQPPLKQVLPIGPQLWDVRSRTRVMGVLNVSPESALAPGRVPDQPAARRRLQERAARYEQEGADSLDLGAQSTRPGHALLPEAEEIRRLTLAVRAAREATPLPLSADTFRPAVAQAALDAGAVMINDVWSARFAPGLVALAVQRGATHAFVHNRLRVQDDGYPPSLRQQDSFAAQNDAAALVRRELDACLAQARSQGQCRWLQVADPGLGFGKKPRQNAALIRDLDAWADWKFPILAGASRKGFLSHWLASREPTALLAGSLAAAVAMALKGVALIRVHDVKATRLALTVADALRTDEASPRESKHSTMQEP